MRLTEEIIFKLARWRLDRLKRQNASARPEHSRDLTGYSTWREIEGEQVLERDFSLELIRDRRVLDFGCGRGELCAFLAESGAREVTGVDMDALWIERARQSHPEHRFVVSESPREIPLPNESVDVITCIDVMEHIIPVREILAEWHRVLVPGGQVLISWEPWLHPFAHHCYRYIPLPWIHAILDTEGRRSVCKRIVDLEEFEPAFWDLDARGKKVNRFSEPDDGAPFLNELTLGRFEALAVEADFEIVRFDRRPMSGSAIARVLSRSIGGLPGFREVLTSIASYELVAR